MAFHSWWFVIEAFMYRHKRERRREARRGHLLFSFPREFSLPVLYSLNFPSQKQQGNSTRKSSFTPPKVKRTKTVPWIPARAHLLKVTLSYYLIWKPRLIIPATSLGGLNKRAFYTVKKKKVKTRDNSYELPLPVIHRESNQSIPEVFLKLQLIERLKYLWFKGLNVNLQRSGY